MLLQLTASLISFNALQRSFLWSCPWGSDVLSLFSTLQFLAARSRCSHVGPRTYDLDSSTFSIHCTKKCLHIRNFRCLDCTISSLPQPFRHCWHLDSALHHMRHAYAPHRNSFDSRDTRMKNTLFGCNLRTRSGDQLFRPPYFLFVNLIV